MIEVTSWLGREFRFDLPNTLFPSVVERVRGTPARVAARVQDVPPDLLRTRVNEGWSIQETIGHLAELELIYIKRTEELLRGDDRLTPVDLSTIHDGGGLPAEVVGGWSLASSSGSDPLASGLVRSRCGG